MSILNKIKTSSIFFLALIFIAMNSCVMYYNTSEIRNNFKKNIDQFNSIADKAKSDFKNKSNSFSVVKSIYSELRKAVSLFFIYSYKPYSFILKKNFIVI